MKKIACLLVLLSVGLVFARPSPSCEGRLDYNDPPYTGNVYEFSVLDGYISGDNIPDTGPLEGPCWYGEAVLEYNLGNGWEHVDYVVTAYNFNSSDVEDFGDLYVASPGIGDEWTVISARVRFKVHYYRWVSADPSYYEWVTIEDDPYTFSVWRDDS